MTSNKRGCEAQTPSLVPPIEASPLLIYSHSGRPNGGVWRRSPNEGPNGWVGRRSPNQTNSQRKQPGSEGGQDQPCSMSDRAWPGGLKDRPTAGQTAAAIGMVQKRVTTQGGWGRRPEGDAPRSEASALGARWLLPARPQPPSYCHLRG